jgi:hypothetical protein
MKTDLNQTIDRLLSQSRATAPTTAPTTVKVAEAASEDVNTRESLSKIAEALRSRPAPRLTWDRVSTVKAGRHVG